MSLWTTLKGLLDDPLARAAAIAGGSVFLALLMKVLVSRWLLLLTRRTRTDLDDKLLQAFGRPLFVSTIVLGLYLASRGLALGPWAIGIRDGVLKTVTVLVWAVAAVRLGTIFLLIISRRAERLSIVQPRTLPLFDMVLKVLVAGTALYFALLAWNVNVTGWLASAGIVGIAVGFAAKDTLANLFAGIFILADAPYKLGDYIVLDNERGRVTDIGIRSTRILTRDGVEITVPNALIANSRIVNESGGPYPKERVRVTVSVAYGSDVDEVRKVLLSCPAGMPHVCSDPPPSARLRELGDSGLKIQLLVWIDEPELRGRVLDDLNTRVYKALNAAGIEIPYAKQDLYIKELPRPGAGG